MSIQKSIKVKLFLFLFFIIKIYCSIIQQYIINDVKINDIKIYNDDYVKTLINCPGNQYITCINGCAKENQDKIIIYSSNSKYCIKKKSSNKIEVTENYNECNRFKFDYTGNDKFKLFDENSNNYIIDKFGNWEWGRAFETEVWDSNSGELSIMANECDYVGGVVLCQKLSMGVYDNGHLFSGTKGKFHWYAEKI